MQNPMVAVVSAEWARMLREVSALPPPKVELLNASDGETWRLEMTTKIKLGDKVRDTVTGFSGVCVARTEWLNGCWRATVQPQSLNKDGGTKEAETFDEFQLERVTPKRVPTGSKETGGPRPEPQRHCDPAR